MRILINKNYFIALPKTNQAGRTIMVYWLKMLYKKELKNARMITSNKHVEKIGVLTRRTI